MAIQLGKGKVISKGGGSTQGLEIQLSKMNDGDSIRLRLIGDVEPNMRYWVKCTNGKQKPIITPYFNKDTEVLDSKDPLLGEGRKEFFYTINALVINSENRELSELKILPLKTTIYRSLVSLAMDDEYGNCTDPESGYDIVITKESTGPLPMNVKYEVRAGRNTAPLTDKEKDIELHNLEELYAQPSEAEYIEWIKMNTDVLNATAPTVDSPTNGEPKPSGDDIPF